MDWWELLITCNSCGWKSLIEEMYIVPDVGRIVCKSCSLKQETRVIEIAEIDRVDEDEDYDDL